MQKSVYIKLGLALVVSLFVSSLLMKEVFIANSPQIRPDLGTHLAGRMRSIVDNPGQFVAKLFGPSKSPSYAEEVLKDIPLQEISKGVYAKSNNEASYTLIKTDEIEWVEYTFQVNGKEIKIKVKKGDSPPPQEFIENLNR